MALQTEHPQLIQNKQQQQKKRTYSVIINYEIRFRAPPSSIFRERERECVRAYEKLRRRRRFWMRSRAWLARGPELVMAGSRRRKIADRIGMSG